MRKSLVIVPTDRSVTTFGSPHEDDDDKFDAEYSRHPPNPYFLRNGLWLQIHCKTPENQLGCVCPIREYGYVLGGC